MNNLAYYPRARKASIADLFFLFLFFFPFRKRNIPLDSLGRESSLISSDLFSAPIRRGISIRARNTRDLLTTANNLAYPNSKVAASGNVAK